MLTKSDNNWFIRRAVSSCIRLCSYAVLENNLNLQLQEKKGIEWNDVRMRNSHGSSGNSAFSSTAKSWLSRTFINFFPERIWQRACFGSCADLLWCRDVDLNLLHMANGSAAIKWNRTGYRNGWFRKWANSSHDVFSAEHHVSNGLAEKSSPTTINAANVPFKKMVGKNMLIG